MSGYKCNQCFDTGCSCGGIGMSCHGCCNCPAGEKAKKNRKKALAEIAKIIGVKELADVEY